MFKYAKYIMTLLRILQLLTDVQKFSKTNKEVKSKTIDLGCSKLLLEVVTKMAYLPWLLKNRDYSLETEIKFPSQQKNTIQHTSITRWQAKNILR